MAEEKESKENGSQEKAQKEAQQKMMEMQMLQQQLQYMKQQIDMIKQQTQELNNTSEALNDLDKIGPGDEVLVPLGAGIFMKADARASKEFVINIGADVAVGKTGEEAVSMIKEQIEEMSKVQKQLEENYQKLIVRAQGLQDEMSGFIG